MKPQVQSLSEIMAELDPASSKQVSLINSQKAGLDAKYAGQQAGLDATKANSFTAINNQATGRGMSFSGVPLDEQATYLGANYMPAVANLKTSQNNESTGLDKNLADIYSNQYNNAFNTRQSQNSALNSWNMQVMQQEASAAEAEKNRQFQASQSAADRAFTASQNAAANALPDIGTAVTDGLINLSSDANWKDSGVTEDLIGQLSLLYNQPIEQIASLVYKARKSAFKF